MHADPRIQPDSHPRGLYHAMSDIEHIDCYPGVCLVQKFKEHDMAFPYMNGQSSLGMLHGRVQNADDFKDRAYVLPDQLFLKYCHASHTDKCSKSMWMWSGHTYQVSRKSSTFIGALHLMFLLGLVLLFCTLQYAFSRYLTDPRERPTRVFDIGLGCRQGNLGASFRLWSTFFPNVDLHIMEIDPVCGEGWYNALTPAEQAKVTSTRCFTVYEFINLISISNMW
jgi:hypothetical protein